VKARRLFGAALDTFVGEPLDARSPLAGEPNIILSPHVAWLSEEAEIKLRVRASEEIVKILGGTEPSTPVGRHRLARR
jgi:D-3-phosphoglycerate dehydrogenase